MTRTNVSLASRLNHRIIIEQPVMVSDNAGGFTQSWSIFAEVWADIMPRFNPEKLQHEQIAAAHKIVFVTRYLAGINEKMRVSYDNRIFNIISVLNPYEEDVLLEITTEEVSV